MAQWIVLRHVKGIIGAKQNVIGAECGYQRSELVRRENDGIDVNALEISRRRLRQRTMAIGARTPGVIDTPGISAQISAAMDGRSEERRVGKERRDVVWG